MLWDLQRRALARRFFFEEAVSSKENHARTF
jgi:hypothetical protein